MTSRASHAGERCEYRRAGAKLCHIHTRWGAVIPDGWTPAGLPVFALRNGVPVVTYD